MATAQERSLLQQLINGQIDKDTYESEVAKIREPARTPEAVANNPFKYTVSGQGYLTLDAIEQEYRDKLKESASDTGNIDIGVARAAQNTAKIKTDYMLSDEYQDDIEQDRLDKIKKNAEDTEGMLNVDVMRGIQNTTTILKKAVTDAQTTLDNRKKDTPTEGTPTEDPLPGDPLPGDPPPEDPPPTVVTPVVEEDDSLFGRLGGQIWNVGGQKYIAFDIPRTGLSMAYTATEEQIDNFFTVDKPQEQTIDSNSDKWSKSFQSGNIVEVDVVNMEASGVVDSLNK